MKKLISLLLIASAIFFLYGCSSVVDTNKTSDFFAPTIYTQDSIADVQIMEAIAGRGCARQWFAFYNQGDTTFLSTSGNEPKTPLDRAKAAAMFDALRTANAKDQSSDILVNPTWSIATNEQLPWVQDFCVQVKGFRGVVKGFNKSDTTTPALPKRRE